MLTDEKLIKKSLVLPFRFTTAYNELQSCSGPAVRKALQALNEAVEISLNNVPKFEGETLVVLDVSSSMSGRVSEISSLFAAVLIKRNNCDFLKFEGKAWYANYNPA